MMVKHGFPSGLLGCLTRSTFTGGRRIGFCGILGLGLVCSFFPYQKQVYYCFSRISRRWGDRGRMASLGRELIPTFLTFPRSSGSLSSQSPIERFPSHVAIGSPAWPLVQGTWNAMGPWWSWWGSPRQRLVQNGMGGVGE